MNELINLRAEAARLAAELGPGLDGLGEDEALRAALKRLGTAILRHEAGRKIQ